MDYFYRHVPEFVSVIVALVANGQMIGWWRERVARPRRRVVTSVGAVAVIWMIAGFTLGLPGVSDEIPGWAAPEWIRGLGMAWGIVSILIWAVEWMFRLLARVAPAMDPSRRQVLGVAKAALVAAPLAAMGYGMFIARRNFRLREIDIPLRGLPADLDGLRLVQITDIHMSPFFSATDLEYAVAMANETRPHIALVTGDLITMPRDPLDRCLALLGRLKSDAGTLGCLGNHEVLARCEDYATGQGRRLGVRFLRGEAAPLRFANAVVNIAGVDYQPFRHPYLAHAGPLVRPDAVNVLLSHNPDVFPVAAALGYDLTVAGHTHGGQVTVELLHQYANVARFFTPYVYGRYERSGKSAWVSRGLGTIGVPARVGAPPEVALIRLCAT